jgi:Tol biopolymer transport system component
MRTTALLSMSVFAVATVVLVAQRPADRPLEDPAVALKAAINRELVDGDLTAAVKRYQEIATRYKTTAPSVAATALVRMAATYEKQGSAGLSQARQIYREVLRTFPNQPDAVAAARTRLDAHAPADRSVRVVQVWADEGATMVGPPSADGRYVAFVDWASGNGNVAVRDLITGRNRVLTHDAASNAWAADALISPDGKRVAYRWAGGKDDSIRVIGSDGTRMQVIARRKDYGDFLSAWSPNGKQIAAVHYNCCTDGTSQIILISVEDHSIKTLKSLGWQQPMIGGFSPDNRFLVYSQPGTPPGRDAVFALAVDGSSESTLAQGSTRNWSPVWNPDGSRVVFLSSRSGAPSLWSIGVRDGRAVGEPELVKNATANLAGIVPVGFTRDGAFYYRAGSVWKESYTAQIDPETLAVSKPAPVTDQMVGSNSYPALAPDGRHVAFFRRTAGPNVDYYTSDSEYHLIVRSTVDRAERDLARISGFVPPFATLVWLPDSRGVLVLEDACCPPRTSAFRAIDTETGRTRFTFEPPRGFFNTVAFSPDGKTLYYSYLNLSESAGGGPADLKSIRLMKRDVETGSEAELHRASSTGAAFFGLSVSPDGGRLAFLATVPETGYVRGSQNERALFVMPAAGGTPRQVYRGRSGDLSHVGAILWGPDGNHLIVSGKCGAAAGNQLCVIPAEGGTLTPIGARLPETTTRMISTDGRTLAFTGTSRSPELWVIRNLLPESTSAR